MLPLHFVPYHQLGETPNVVVDGSPTASTVLTLSHWPGSPTPPEVWADLSAEIALRALDRPAWFTGVDAVSNNHFDQDGLAAAYALVAPGDALRHASLLVELAAAGDFATLTGGIDGRRDGARLSMAVAAFADEARSPLDRAVFAGSYPEQCANLYVEMLDRLPALLADPASCRELWADEDAHLEASLAAIAAGSVRIDELPEIDLAIVTIDDDVSADPAVAPLRPRRGPGLDGGGAPDGDQQRDVHAARPADPRPAVPPRAALRVVGDARVPSGDGATRPAADRRGAHRAGAGGRHVARRRTGRADTVPDPRRGCREQPRAG